MCSCAGWSSNSRHRCSDGSPFTPDGGGFAEIIEFHGQLYDELKLADEIRQRIDHENAQMLFGIM